LRAFPLGELAEGQRPFADCFEDNGSALAASGDRLHDRDRGVDPIAGKASAAPDPEHQTPPTLFTVDEIIDNVNDDIVT
jgi:hypothetical protein